MTTSLARRPLEQSRPPRGASAPWRWTGRAALAGAGLCLVAALVWPDLRPVAMGLAPAAVAVVVLAGMRVHRAGPGSLWPALLATLAFQAVSNGLWHSSPQAARVAGLCALGGLLETLRRLGRRGGIDLLALTDTAMVVTAGSALLSQLLWVPVAAGGLTAEEVAAIVVTSTDVVIIAQLVYALLATVSLASVPARLLAVSVLGSSLTHVVVIVAHQGFGESMRPHFAVMYVAFDLLVAVAALHPAMAHVGIASGPAGRLTGGRLGLLGLCGLTPMVVLLGVPGERATWLLGVHGVVIITLLIVRLGRALTGRDHDQRREEALRAGLTALLVATDNTTIELAVVLAARNLLEDRGATIRVLPDEAQLAQPIAVFGPGFRGAPSPSVAAAVHHDGNRPWLLCVAVPSSNGPRGMLVAAVGKAPSTPLRDAFQTLAGQLGLARERAAMAEAMHRRHSEHRLAALVQNAFDVITILDQDLVVQFQSPSITAVLGHHPDDVLSSKFRSLLDPEDAPGVEAQLLHLASGLTRTSTRIDCRLRHRNDDWLDVEITATNLLADPDVRGLVLNIRDVSERKALEHQLVRQAFHDPLTGLANRVLLADRVEHALQVTSRGGSQPAVLFIDLDDFKMINDSLGHPAGDRLLVELAERLAGCLRPGDTAARIGGDEFAVLLENAGSAPVEALREVADRVLRTMGEPLVIDGTEITPRASIGVASGIDAGNAPDLLRNADLAMYIAKAQGGGVAMFEASMHDSARRRLELQAELARAIDREEFELHFQPIVTLHVEGPDAELGLDGLLTQPQIMGVEALVRWNHPQRGRIAPVEFIPLAEETGLIVPLGRWILIEACRTVAGWASEGLVSALSLTINVSARQLHETSLVDDVSAAISSSGIDPSWLVIEITESVVMHDTSASVGWLHALKQLGVRVAIDDFGTGYSSLAYLQLFPIDVMKIDRSFVIGLGTDPKATELVRAVINLSDSLGMTTLAEGIETAEQLAELNRLGCKLGQGFAFAKPMSSGALITAVEDGVLAMAKPGPNHPGMHPGRDLLADDAA